MRMGLLPRQQQQRQHQQTTPTPTNNTNKQRQRQQTTTTPTNNSNKQRQRQQTTPTTTPTPRSTGHSFVQAINSAAVGAKLERKGRPTPRSGVGLRDQAALLQQLKAAFVSFLLCAKGRTKTIGVSDPLHKGQKLSFHKAIQ